MSLSTEHFDFLRELLRDKVGITLGAEKAYLAESRLAPLAREHAAGDINTLVSRLRDPGQRELRRQTLEAMAIHETFFFRDPGLMTCLQEKILPNLVLKRSQEKRLRIWSAACSTGQEAWTLCLMLREHFPEVADWDIQILASDFSRQALEQARSGRYGLTDINRGMPARMLVSWFRQSGAEWQVKPELQRMVEFREINLVDQWPELPHFDLILLRNVLIYFDDATRQDVMTRVRQRLAGDGFLILGGTERARPEHGFAQGGHCNSLPCYQPAI